MKRLVWGATCLLALAALAGGTACKPTSTPPGDAGVRCADTDKDGIGDNFEGRRDTDNDGTPDDRDPDSDGDGIPDAVEGGTGGDACKVPLNSDGDGLPDFQDRDSDAFGDDTVGDAEEAGKDPTRPVDSDGDNVPDYRDTDDDGDGVFDRVELVGPNQTEPATTLAAAPDTDKDGAPDLLDPDADGDGIPDGVEGTIDTDSDHAPNFRDLDSDDDCLTDAIEAQNPQSPIDTDKDDAPDFLDLDSDNDGLADKAEDRNCNGSLDAAPDCETDRLVADSDGDGVTDLIEREACLVKPPAQQMALKCACDATDPKFSPLTRGDFVFVSDYMKDPTPDLETLDLSTDVSQADVIFALDTTGSMQRCLTNLASGLANTVVPLAKAKVSSIAFGVLDFKDFGDTYVVKYDHRIQTVNTMPGVMGIQTALSALMAAGGGDGPEAGWEALYAIAGGPPIMVQGYDSDLKLGNVPPQPPLMGEKQGTLGGAGFRQGSVPIVVTVADAEWHDAPGSQMGGDPESGLNAFPNGRCTCNGVPSRRMALDQLKKLNAHVMGLAALGSKQTGNPKARAVAVATESGATVRPDAFGPAGKRPVNCPVGQCCTGQDGAGETPVAGTCPLAFTVNGDTGQGVSDSVVAGIVALANGLSFDIHVVASDVDPGTVDNFIERLVPNLTGQGPAVLCVRAPWNLQDNFSGPRAAPGKDGVPDTFLGVGSGQRVCFDVIPRRNETTMNTEQVQFFHAQITVKGTSGGPEVNLGYPRDVFFLVPPVIKNGPIK